MVFIFFQQITFQDRGGKKVKGSKLKIPKYTYSTSYDTN